MTSRACFLRVGAVALSTIAAYIIVAAFCCCIQEPASMTWNRFVVGVALAASTAIAIVGGGLMGGVGAFFGISVDWQQGLQNIGITVAPETAIFIFNWGFTCAVITGIWIFAFALMYHWRMLPGQAPVTIAASPDELQQLEVLKEQHRQAKNQIVSDQSTSRIRIEQLERQATEAEAKYREERDKATKANDDIRSLKAALDFARESKPTGPADEIARSVSPSPYDRAVSKLNEHAKRGRSLETRQQIKEWMLETRLFVRSTFVLKTAREFNTIDLGSGDRPLTDNERRIFREALAWLESKHVTLKPEELR